MLASYEATMQSSEDQLIVRCLGGDLDAFGQVYARYERQVFRYAYHLLGSREEADDVKQETFLRAYKALSAFRSQASLQTWLLRICHNLCYDHLRSWERRNVVCQREPWEYSSAHSDESSDPHFTVERKQIKELIARTLYALPAAHREIVILHDIEELSYEEIGKILGCSTTAAKVRLFRARRCLKDRVQALLALKD